MSDRTLDVLIRILTEQVGEQKASEVMEQYKQATASTTDVIHDQTKAVERQGLSHHELRKVLMDIGNVAAPGAGHALAELAFGPVGAALALVAAFEAVRKKIEAVDEQEQELNEKELDKHLQSIKDIKQAWDDALTSFRTYQAEVDAAGQEKDPMANQLKRIQAVSAAQTEAHLKAMKELGDEHVAWLKDHGASPELIAQTEAANQREQDKIKDEAAHKSVEQIQADINERAKKQPALDEAAKQAQLKVEAAKEELNRANAALANATDPEARKAAKKKEEETAAAIENVKAVPDEDFDPVRGTRTDNRANKAKALAAAEAAHKDALAEQQRLDAAQRAAEDAITKAKQDQVDADQAFKRASAAGVSNQQRITDEKVEVGTKQAVQTEKEKGERTDEAAHEFGVGKGIADTLANGGSVKQAQAAFLQALESQITGHNLTLQQAVVAMELQSKNQEFMVQLISNAGNKILEIEPRLRWLEEKFNNFK